MPTTITLPYTLSNGATADATEVQADLDAIANEYNSSVAAVTGDVVGTTATQTLTNKDISSATNTLPTSVVTLTGTQTLTNKTVTKPIINGSVQAFTSYTDGATVTFDLSASNVHTVVLGGNRTLALSNVSTGQSFVIRLVQDATGSRTVTWFSTIKWPNGVTPTLTTTANKTDVFGFICTGSGTYDGFTVGTAL